MKEGLTFGERLRLLAGRQRKVCTEGLAPDVVCGSKSPGRGLVCNRGPGHDGRCGELTGNQGTGGGGGSATCAKGWWEKPARDSGHEGAFMRDGKWIMPEQPVEGDGVDAVDFVDGIPWADWKAARERIAAKSAPSSAARWIRHLIREAGEAVDHLEREGSSEDVLAAAAMVRARWVELLRLRGYEVDEVAVPCGHELSDLREWFDKGGWL